jgi:hypothetical protein
MSERCLNCGSELFAGQQFCRACGAAVRGAGEEAATQLFPQPPEPPASTARLDPRGTDPVRDPRPTGYQPPVYQSPPPAAFRQTAPLGVEGPPPRRGRGGWVVALVAVAVVSILGTLAIVFALRSRHQPVQRVVVKQGGHGVGVGGVAPPALPDLPERVREAVESSGVPFPIDESGAEVSAGQTEFTKTYELDEGASFSLKNLNGPVRVEGWDEPRAEVRVVKRGGTPEMRRGVPVLSSRGDGGVMLMSMTGRGVPVSVAYEIKLPRTLRQVEIAAETSEVRVEGLEGTVVVDVKAGRLEFKDVTGVVRSQIIKGHTKVSYEHADREGPQEFKANLGDVELTLPEDFNADLKAETIDGRIEVDEDLGLSVVKAAAGRHVVGRLGEGREPLLIRVVNGDIKLRR